MLRQRGDAHAAAIRDIALESFGLNAYRLHCASRRKEQLSTLTRRSAPAGSTAVGARDKATLGGKFAVRGTAIKTVNTTSIAKKRTRFRLLPISRYLSSEHVLTKQKPVQANPNPLKG